MSTKIHHGHRLPATTNLAAMARDINARAAAVHRVMAIRAVAAVACYLVSYAPLGKDDNRLDDTLEVFSSGQVKRKDLHLSSRGIGTVLHQAAEIVDAIQNKLANPATAAQRVPLAVDLQFSYVVLDDPANTDWLYALTYTDREEFDAIWAQTPGVEPWPYWNNADEPEGMDYTEWEARGATWERVLPDCAAPARIGMSWEFAPEFDLVNRVSGVLGEGAWLNAHAVLDCVVSFSKDPATFALNRQAMAEALAAKVARPKLAS